MNSAFDVQSVETLTLFSRVDRASLTGGFVIVEGKLKEKTIRIHVGGGRRFELLEAVGTTITCGLSNVALIPREETSDSAVSSLQTSP